MKNRVAGTLAAACIALALGACHNNKSTASKEPAGTVAMSNANCPISGKPANQNVTSTYNGQAVHFCCPGCKAKFDAMSDADKAKAVAHK